MSYIALYREWRPARFEDVVEQEHVVKTLRYSVSTGRIAHAYLFCGTRGTGKTTMAQILSRAVNCLDPQDGEPCNKCEICLDILSGSSVDVLEIDAASNNSVDNVRSIRDEVVYAPVKARRKVYIIDEVHMLSTGAFNALLKTLEEPPEHVMFILATTEPHKLPATILSRCQRFDFRRISQEGIAGQLGKIASADGVILEDDAARLIARLSDGAMRDAISLLDQCMSLGVKKISYDDVLSVAGIVNDEFLAQFAGNMLAGNIPAVLENIGRLVADGRDIAHFTSDLVLHFRNLLVIKSAGDNCGNLVDAPAELLETLKKQAGSVSQDEIIRYIRELSSLAYNLKWAANQRVLLEVTAIRLCGSNSHPHADTDIAGRLSALEKRLEESLLFQGQYNTRKAEGHVPGQELPQAGNTAPPKGQYPQNEAEHGSGRRSVPALSPASRVPSASAPITPGTTAQQDANDFAPASSAPSKTPAASSGMHEAEGPAMAHASTISGSPGQSEDDSPGQTTALPASAASAAPAASASSPASAVSPAAVSSEATPTSPPAVSPEAAPTSTPASSQEATPASTSAASPETRPEAFLPGDPAAFPPTRASAPVSSHKWVSGSEPPDFDYWPEVLNYLKSRGKMALYSYLLNVRAKRLDNDTIGLVTGESNIRAGISRVEHLKIIEEALKKATGRQMRAVCVNEDFFTKVDPKETGQAEAVGKAKKIAEITGLPLEVYDE